MKICTTAKVASMTAFQNLQSNIGADSAPLSPADLYASELADRYRLLVVPLGRGDQKVVQFVHV